MSKPKGDKKKADAIINDGVKFLDRGEIQRAKESFEHALSIYHDHPDALYNIGVLHVEELERKIESCEIDVGISDELLFAFQYFDRIIQLDTSRRGETTGFAYRSKANAILNCFVDLKGHPERSRLLRDAYICFEKCIQISQNSHDLDTIMFEFSQLKRIDMSDHIQLYGEEYPQGELQAFERICKSFESLSLVLNQTLQTAYSSGIDRDIIIYCAGTMCEFWEFVYGNAQLNTFKHLVGPQLHELLTKICSETWTISSLASLIADNEASMFALELFHAVAKWSVLNADLSTGVVALEALLENTKKSMHVILQSSTSTVDQCELLALMGDVLNDCHNLCSSVEGAPLASSVLWNLTIACRICCEQLHQRLSSRVTRPGWECEMTSADSAGTELLEAAGTFGIEEEMESCSGVPVQAELEPNGSLPQQLLTTAKGCYIAALCGHYQISMFSRGPLVSSSAASIGGSGGRGAGPGVGITESHTDGDDFNPAEVAFNLACVSWRLRQSGCCRDALAVALLGYAESLPAATFQATISDTGHPYDATLPPPPYSSSSSEACISSVASHEDDQTMTMPTNWDGSMSIAHRVEGELHSSPSSWGHTALIAQQQTLLREVMADEDLAGVQHEPWFTELFGVTI